VSRISLTTEVALALALGLALMSVARGPNVCGQSLQNDAQMRLGDYPDGHPLKALDKELKSLRATSPLSEPAPGDDELKKLRKERYQSAQLQCEKFFDLFLAGSLSRGRDPLDLLMGSMDRLVESELALSDKPADQIAALERKVTLAKGAEAINKIRYDEKRIALQDYEQTRYERLDAEIKLLELKQKLGVAPKK
jgi:hypothetical protein